MLESLKAYIKLLPTAVKNADQIAEGLWNKLNSQGLNDVEKEVIIKRALICESCPYNSKNVTDPEIKSERPDDHCIHCGCNIDLKIHCLSCRCGIEVYNAKNPENKIEVKWQPYITP
ncbi:hypothetical protein [Leptolyngbya phage Lbo-JY46]